MRSTSHHLHLNLYMTINLKVTLTACLQTIEKSNENDFFFNVYFKLGPSFVITTTGIITLSLEAVGFKKVQNIFAYNIHHLHCWLKIHFCWSIKKKRLSKHLSLTVKRLAVCSLKAASPRFQHNKIYVRMTWVMSRRRLAVFWIL